MCQAHTWEAGTELTHASQGLFGVLQLEAAEERLQEVKRLMKAAGFEAAELRKREAAVRQEVGGLLKEAEQVEGKVGFLQANLEHTNDYVLRLACPSLTIRLE